MLKIKSIAAILLSGALWGTMGVFIRILHGAGITNYEIVFLRALTGALVMGLLLLGKDRSLFRIQIKDIWIFACLGIISFAAMAVVYYTAIEFSSMAVGAALLYTSPVFVILISAVLFRERLTPFKLLAVGLTVLGSFAMSGIFGGKLTYSLFGLGMGVLSGLLYGLYSIFGRFGVEKYSPMTINFYSFSFATAALLPFVRFGPLTAALADARMLLWAVAACVVTAVLPYFFYTYGLKVIPSGTAAVLATVEPVTATLISVIAYGEQMPFFKLVGLLSILCSVVLAALDGVKRKK